MLSSILNTNLILPTFNVSANSMLNNFSSSPSLSSSSTFLSSNSSSNFSSNNDNLFLNKLFGKKNKISKKRSLSDDMFCFQCEQTSKGVSCSPKMGVCGKNSIISNIQDEVTNKLKTFCYLAKDYYYENEENEKEILNCLNTMFDSFYGTLTNTNFNRDRFESDWIKKIDNFTEKFLNLNKKNNKLSKKQFNDLKDKIFEAEIRSIPERVEHLGKLIPSFKGKIAKDIVYLEEFLLYGIKGYIAYYVESLIENNYDEKKRDKSIDKFFVDTFSLLFKHEMGQFDENEIKNPKIIYDKMLNLILECGKINLSSMASLDSIHNENYGKPTPTEVQMFPPKNGKSILVSGHNLKDIKLILEAIDKQNLDINVYTHSEMLPTHGYPELNKYKQLAGNFGSAWFNQKKELDTFPGAIVFTTNCIVPMSKNSSYKNRFFTTSVAGEENEMKHLNLENEKDMKLLLDTAIKSEGFNEKNIEKVKKVMIKTMDLNENEQKNGRKVLTGFGHKTVTTDLADLVVSGIKDGYVKHFFLVGGCDGYEKSRNVFTEFCEKAPKDTVILTCGCGKYKVNILDLGVIKTPKGDIPRILDVGQCNDSFGAIMIADTLRQVFNLESVNDLPLSLIVSWFEQKAVAVLFSLLHLGIKNIRLGPSLPAFCPPDVLNILVDKFNLVPVGDGTNVDQELEKMMKGN